MCGPKVLSCLLKQGAVSSRLDAVPRVERGLIGSILRGDV